MGRDFRAGSRPGADDRVAGGNRDGREGSRKQMPEEGGNGGRR